MEELFLYEFEVLQRWKSQIGGDSCHTQGLGVSILTTPKHRKMTRNIVPKDSSMLLEAKLFGLSP